MRPRFAKLRARSDQPDFAWVRSKWRARPLGRALLRLLDGRTEDRDAAISGLAQLDATGGTWSDRGLALVRLATLFDWLDQELEDATRQAVVRKIERAADDAVAHIGGGQAPYFYTRTPGALAGLCVAGLALHGLSDKAEGYLETFREFGVQEYFRAARSGPGTIVRPETIFPGEPPGCAGSRPTVPVRE